MNMSAIRFSTPVKARLSIVFQCTLSRTGTDHETHLIVRQNIKDTTERYRRHGQDFAVFANNRSGSEGEEAANGLLAQELHLQLIAFTNLQALHCLHDVDCGLT